MTNSTDHPSRPRLSVAMIVRDEQDVLADSIKSIQPIADEIVVLDTGSTDQTVSVANQFDAEIGWMSFGDDFSAARNRCLTMATGDWVLWLDAGEILSEDSAAELREFVNRQADVTKAYLLMIQVPPTDPAASAEQIAQLRLMPNRKGLRFQGRVRETLWPSIEATGLEIDMAPGRIVRHPRQHDQARKTLCAHRDLKLAMLEISETDGPLPPRLQLAMGEAYTNIAADEQARQAFCDVIETAPRGSTEMLEAYYGLLTSYDVNKFLSDVQFNACAEALEAFPFDAQLLLVMGNYLQAKNRLDLAARSFETAVKYGQVDLGAWHLSELTEVAASCQSLTLQTQNDDGRACCVLEEGLQRNPDSTRLRRLLIDLHVKKGRCDAALELADGLPVPSEQREPLRNALRGACKAAEQDWTPALGYLQSAYMAGCGDPICLRWLSVTLLSNAQVEAAEPVLRDWERLEPANVELRAYLAVLQQRRDAETQRQEPPEEEPSVADSIQRHLRVDEGTLVLPTAPALLPTISHVSSVESVTD